MESLRASAQLQEDDDRDALLEQLRTQESNYTKAAYGFDCIESGINFWATSEAGAGYRRLARESMSEADFARAESELMFEHAEDDTQLIAAITEAARDRIAEITEFASRESAQRIELEARLQHVKTGVNLEIQAAVTENIRLMSNVNEQMAIEPAHSPRPPCQGRCSRPRLVSSPM